MIDCMILMVLQPRENARVFGFEVQLACGQFGHLIKNFFSYPEFLEPKSHIRKDVPFRGVVDSAHFSSHEKRSYPTFAYTGKYLVNYSQKLSNISQQSKLIPKELRYQETIYAISDMPRKNILQIFPNFLFFLFFKHKKTKHAIWK
jgi:hypothetical protein